MNTATLGRSIPFGRPILAAREKELAAAVLEGHMLTHGPRCAEFEKAFASRVGVEHAVTVSSCTTGLQLCLMSLDLEPGDEVIVPAETHVATAHAVEHVGARVVFVDVCRETGNMDPSAVARAVTERTRVIMPVHYLGLPCDMDALHSIAAERDIKIIEDCALAIGSHYDGTHAGGLGDAGVFSFYPAKHITTLEGGMVTTNCASFADRVRHLRAFGYDRGLNDRKIPGIYDVVSLGHNFRMSEVHAAVGLGQLEQLDTFLQARRRNANILHGSLGDRRDIAMFPFKSGKSDTSYYCVNIMVDETISVRRDDLILEFNTNGIGTSVHYPVPVPLSSYYRQKYGYDWGEFPVAEWISGRAISLPVGPHLSEDDAHFVGETVASILDGHGV